MPHGIVANPMYARNVVTLAERTTGGRKADQRATSAAHEEQFLVSSRSLVSGLDRSRRRHRCNLSRASMWPNLMRLHP